MKTKLEDRPTKTQRRLLIQHMKDTRHIEGKGKDRKYQWQKITMELNTLGPPKSLAQWKKQWQNMRLATRKKLQEISRRHPGSPIPELNEEDNEIMEIEASHAESQANRDYQNSLEGQSSSNAPITNFKQDPYGNEYNMDFQQNPEYGSMPQGEGANFGEMGEMRVRRKYKKRIKKEMMANGDCGAPQNYIQPKTKLSMEIKSRAYKGMCEIAKTGKKKKKHMDSDELFLMSFVGELKKIPEYKKLQVKGDIIAIFKKWSFKTQETQVSDDNFEESKSEVLNEIAPPVEDPHPQKMFDIGKSFEHQIQRPVSQLSHNSSSLGGPTSPLNLQQQSSQQPQPQQQQQQQQLPQQQQQQQNTSSHFNVQPNSLLHSVQQLIPIPQHQNLQQLQHQQQQIIHQHHNVSALPTQHFPIYQRYGNL